MFICIADGHEGVGGGITQLTSGCPKGKDEGKEQQLALVSRDEVAKVGRASPPSKCTPRPEFHRYIRPHPAQEFMTVACMAFGDSVAYSKAGVKKKCRLKGLKVLTILSKQSCEISVKFKANTQSSQFSHSIYYKQLIVWFIKSTSE